MKDPKHMIEISKIERDGRDQPLSTVRIVTSSGIPIYLLPVETFPGHRNNIYLIDHPDTPWLFDCGTPGSGEELEQRFREIRDRFAVRTSLSDLSGVLISHAHMDHFGAAHRFQEMGIPILIHEYDARVLADFQQRRVIMSRDLGLLFHRSGMEKTEADALTEVYLSGKQSFRDLEPDRRLCDGDSVGAGWSVLHVPGHCPGMVCLRIDDVVLTADHLLSRITPLQCPHAIAPGLGLENYLDSLEKLKAFGSSSVALGAHELPIEDIPLRIAQTRAHHMDRLLKTLELCREDPRTLHQLTLRLFGPQQHYGKIMAVVEAAAHVEYLYDLGFLEMTNIDDVIGDTLLPPRYRARRLDFARERFSPPAQAAEE